MPTQEQLNNLIYKYIQGFPYTSTQSSRSLEQPGSAFPILSSNKIRTNDVPDIALFSSSNDNYPTSGFSETIFPDYPTINSGGNLYSDISGGRQYITNDVSYSYMTYYVNLPLKCVNTENVAFFDASTNTDNITGTNRLIGAIPSNYDPANASYKIFVFNSLYPTLSIDPDGNNSWYFDPNSGYLVFDNPINFIPTMTFWRYEGPYGISNSESQGITYPDGSTQISANYLTPIQVNATDRITATNSMESHELTCVELYCNTINITDKIIDANDTGTALNSFIYNATTMAYKDPIVNNTPLVVAVGDRVKSNGIGLQPIGDTGLQIANINTTNRIITFNPEGNFDLSNQPIITSSLLAITSTSTFTSYISLGGHVGSGLRGVGTSSNQPFLNAIVSQYNYNTPTASLTYSPTTKAGYINSNSRLVSLDSYPNQNFISMTGISNPSYISATFGTNDYTITSRNEITPNTITGEFRAIPLTNTTLTYPTFAGANTDFITQLNNISAGTKSTNNTATGVLTLSISHPQPNPTSTDVSGYVTNNTLKLEANPIIASHQYVTGTGTATNGIPTNRNSFISAIPTAPSSQYTIRSGTGTLSATNTPSTAIEGYTRFTTPDYFFISTTPLTDNYFIESSGVPQATRTRNPIAPYTNQLNIMRLTQLNGYNPTATATSFVFNGIVANATQIKVTSAPVGFSSGFMLENATSIPTSFNSLIPNGTKNTGWDSTNQIITCSGLTASSATLTNLKGYMRTTTLLEVRGLGDATSRLNYFFTGSGIGENKNYVSASSSTSPYTLASTNTATTATGVNLPGYTRFKDSSSFYLVLENPNPFKTANYFISSTSLLENTGLTNNTPLNQNNAILVNADFRTYTTANVTARQPPTGAYRAYPVSSTTYYVLEDIASGGITDSSSYIEAFKLDNTNGFAGNLTRRGNRNADNLFTTTATITVTPPTTGIIGAIYNAGGVYYFCSSALGNETQRFLVGTTIAPASSIIYNTTTFNRGSNNISAIQSRRSPTASTFLTNSNLAYIIKSNSTSSEGRFLTTIWCKFAATRVTMANNKFFINGALVSSPLNGAYVSSFTQPATLLGFSATLTGDNSTTATGIRGTSTFQAVISTTQFTANCNFTPAVGDFVEIIANSVPQGINYVTAVGSAVAPANFTITIAYSGNFSAPNTVTFIAPINTTSSLLNETTSITTHLEQNLVLYESGSTYSYYVDTNLYSAFSPMTINVYNSVANNSLAIEPIQYSIKTPFTYNYITPLSITDFSRTTFSLYPTETITFFTFFDIALPPNSANTTLVSVDAIQTLTNKTFTGNVGINQVDPQYNLDVTGQIRATAQITGFSFNAMSDYRLKTNIENISKEIIIDKLRPVQYDMSGSNRHDMGFIAHEVQEILPFLVTGEKDGDKFQSLNYNGFIAVLVKEIKDLKSRLLIAENQIQTLMSKI